MQGSNLKHLSLGFICLFLIGVTLIMLFSCVPIKPTAPTPTLTPIINPYHLLIDLWEVEQLIGAGYEEMESITSKPEELGKGIPKQYERSFLIKDGSLIVAKPMMILSTVAIYQTNEEAQSSFKPLEQEKMTTSIIEDQRCLKINSDLDALLVNIRNPIQNTFITEVKYLKENLIVAVVAVGKTQYYDSFALELAKNSAQRLKPL